MFKKNLILLVIAFLFLPGAENSFARTITLNNSMFAYSTALNTSYYLGKHNTRFNRFQRNLIILTNIEKTDSFPNIFTPNGDGINDVFEIKGLDESKQYNLKIFNRWGQLIFETESPRTTLWDGRTPAGIAVPEGVYYFILTGENNNVNKGFITVLK